METFYSVIIAVHILVAAAIVGLILMQHGKGADMGAAFGSGASGSLFGASGSANFLSRTTALLAAIFFLTSLALAYIVAQPKSSSSIMESPIQSSSPAAAPAIKVEPESQQSVPATDSAPPAEGVKNENADNVQSASSTQNAGNAQGAGTDNAAGSAVKEPTPVTEERSKVDAIPAD